ncbi:LacI family DNA-binding transcriptional regulator [Paracholeplasma manati]|uniref:LacI family DNA-binding transcriptional regulator n=1 Tax=Paracholeplasma manati TaxID=591373 RepID=A0ABT2Y816_9MOLU|nr:LacI family DNA-binding transcriptional regulator [Paracholeplasma manati]MCV2232897.1 LacI family DNA-binding transcriptional regulator [Paracholeplasma manati]MDG0888664.1 LacI family DNA-binding transcriptional regulator [Paracholeplasma manati]
MATIKDVAKKANVSVATVSRVINKKGYVNEETRALVENAIHQLNYIPNELARSLFNKHSKLIGVLVPHFDTQFYAELIEGIENAAMKLGYKIMLSNTQDNAKREKDYIHIYSQYNIDGIIVASNAHNVEQLIKSDLPIVTVDHILSENIPSITSNNILGGIIAAQKLISGGARYILELRGPSFLLTVSERSLGFRQVLVQNNIPYISYDTDLLNPSIDVITKIIEDHPQIDAIFATSDFLAIHAQNILQKLGRKVPEEVQIVGFDNIVYTTLVSPTITTIEQPIRRMGELALESLVKLLNEESLGDFHSVLDVKLIERESTK